MLPVLRHQAIEAGVRQTEADLRASEAMHRQTSNDLAARVVSDLAMLHDAQRQIDLYEKTLLPGANNIVSSTQRAYGAGQSSMLDLVDAQRSLITLRRMLAELRMLRERQIADLEAAAALGLKGN
jgi:outer membrane protein TolC